MGIKKYNPTTPGLRGMTVSTFEEITCSTPEKSLTVTLKKHSGRNNRGKITVRHRGGGYRPKYRIIDFKRNKDGIPGKVATIEYDPNRTANIPGVRTALVGTMNVYEIINYTNFIVTKEAIEKIEEVYA